MRMGQGVRTGLGHGGITCVLQTQFYSFSFGAEGAKYDAIQGQFTCWLLAPFALYVSTGNHSHSDQ